jgi:hypothetical protein
MNETPHRYAALGQHDDDVLLCVAMGRSIVALAQIAPDAVDVVQRRVYGSQHITLPSGAKPGPESMVVARHN